MLKKNFLASNVVYVCVKHNETIIKKYLSELDKIFLKLRKILMKKKY